MYYVYILKSSVDGSFYIGYSENPEQRLVQHNNGGSLYTRRKMPWQLVYQEAFGDKSSALKRERFLKAQKNRIFYQKLIDIQARSVD